MMKHRPHISEFDNDQVQLLGNIVGRILPGCRKHEMPGADDPLILADIAASLGQEEEAVRLALKVISEMAQDSFGEMSKDDQMQLLENFRAANPALARALEVVTVTCYYRDDRVMDAIGMEVRPPFPKGYSIPQGDWSLLDPVRARGKVYREIDETHDAS